MILFLEGKVYNSFSKKKVRRSSVRATLNCQNKLRFFFFALDGFYRFKCKNVNFFDLEKVSQFSYVTSPAVLLPGKLNLP